ncbi:hypothetical protein JTB14_019858 [Gonioctena quinquepunctata]|nr:hypothetical protein JTB14_019858 [Gonioctena quinquepunctata]
MYVLSETICTSTPTEDGPFTSRKSLMSQKLFSATGIDYFGPFQVKIERPLEKRYGILFTCLTMRAIHVDIAHSLEADSCMMAMRRFLVRRRAVKVFWSDSGTNFNGANKALSDALEDLEINTVVDDMTSRGIN